MANEVDLKQCRKTLSEYIQNSVEPRLKAEQVNLDAAKRALQAVNDITERETALKNRSVEFEQREASLRGASPKLEAEATQKRVENAELDRQGAALRGVIAKLKEEAETEQDTIDRLEARKAELETEVGRLAGRVEVQRAERRVS